MNTWDQLVLHPFRNREIKNQRQLNRLTKLSSHVSISFDYVYGQISTFRASFLRKNLPAFSSPFVNLRNCQLNLHRKVNVILNLSCVFDLALFFHSPMHLKVNMTNRRT